MARPPTHRHILREIRNIVGWSQQELAQRLGVSEITINRIENGQLKVSKRIALRAYSLTGVSYQDILENKAGIPETREGALTRESIQRLARQAKELTFDQVATVIDNHTYHLELLFDATHEFKPQKIWALDAAISEALNSVAEEFELQGYVARVKQDNVRTALSRNTQKGIRPGALPVPPSNEEILQARRERYAKTLEKRKSLRGN
jgi:transcriptional regulator with XRE-family HTH domain